MRAAIAGTAQVDPGAEFAEGVEIGPYCVIGPGVTIGRGTRLLAHVHLTGAVRLGEWNLIGPFSALGGDPQDTSYRGTATRVEVGDRNVIREHVTIHRGSEKEDGATRIGSHNRLLRGSHVAHDCQLGDRVTLGPGTMLAGHVRVGSHATLSAGVAVLQFVTIGGHSLIGPKSKVVQDAPPFLVSDGNPSEVRRVLATALRCHGLDRTELAALGEAFRLIYRARVGLAATEEALRSRGQLTPATSHLLQFVAAQRAGRHGRGRGASPGVGEVI